MSKTKLSSDGDEILEVVEKNGKVLGLAKRSEIHQNPSLIHRVIHVLVFNSKGELLLQKRSLNKDVAPGKWDTSVGGHVNPGEDILEAALREIKEELGISDCNLEYLYAYLFSNNIETELVSTFSCVYNGTFCFNKDEMDEIEFWDIKEIKINLGKNVFSNHFEKEISAYLQKTAMSNE